MFLFKHSRRAWYGGYFSRKVTQKFPPVVGIVRLIKLAFFAIGKLLVLTDSSNSAYACANFIGSIHSSSNGGGEKTKDDLAPMAKKKFLILIPDT